VLRVRLKKIKIRRSKMKPKFSKKLVLNKDTIAHLNPRETRKLKGGNLCNPYQEETEGTCASLIQTMPGEVCGCDSECASNYCGLDPTL
jgi:hypothetical protein